MMAKRTAKSTSPTEGVQPASFQIPEVAPDLPNPWDEIAATAPRLPSTGEVTADTAPMPKVKPTLPTGIKDYDPNNVQRTKPSLLDPYLIMRRPALGRMTMLGTELLGTCAMANQLGNREPLKALVTFSDDQKWFFLMPTNPKADKAVEITYQQKQACINLWGPFEEIRKSVERGQKEYYALEMTEEPIKIHGVKGYALYISMEQYKKEAIQQREERATEGRSSAKASKTAQRRSATGTVKTAPTGTARPTEAAAAPADAPDDVPESPRKLQATIDERNAQLDDRDDQIDELQERLKAYEERFGEL